MLGKAPDHEGVCRGGDKTWVHCTTHVSQLPAKAFLLHPGVIDGHYGMVAKLTPDRQEAAR